MKIFERPGVLLLLVFVAMLPVMILMPFNDTTEPRYAEIARLMLERNDWITPWFDPNTPFWGKPPLSFWAQALSMKLLGVHEFAARLPSWICLLLTTMLLYRVAYRLLDQQRAMWASLIYASAVLSVTSGAGVLTDPFLNLGITLGLVSFIMTMEGASRLWWGYGFFIGLSIALLAKGPLALVLLGVPLFVWVLLSFKTRFNQLKKLPWLGGTLLTIVLVIPWYVLAEIKTPGFLNYFILGEHIYRFIDPGWAGDLYGTAHDYPRGTIWWLLLQASAPWSVLGLIYLGLSVFSVKARQQIKEIKAKPYFSLFFLFFLITPVFFSLSGNVLWTYVLPSLPAFGYLLAVTIIPYFEQQKTKIKYVPQVFALLMPILAVLLAVSAVFAPNSFKSEKQLIAYWQKEESNCALYYVGKPPFSARFYSREQSKGIPSQVQENQLVEWIAKQGDAEICLGISKRSESLMAMFPNSQFPALFETKRFKLIKVKKEELKREQTKTELYL